MQESASPSRIYDYKPKIPTYRLPCWGDWYLLRSNHYKNHLEENNVNNSYAPRPAFPAFRSNQVMHRPWVRKKIVKSLTRNSQAMGTAISKVMNQISIETHRGLSLSIKPHTIPPISGYWIWGLKRFEVVCYNDYDKRHLSHFVLRNQIQPPYPGGHESNFGRYAVVMRVWCQIVYLLFSTLTSA